MLQIGDPATGREKVDTTLVEDWVASGDSCSFLSRIHSRRDFKGTRDATLAGTSHVLRFRNFSGRHTEPLRRAMSHVKLDAQPIRLRVGFDFGGGLQVFTSRYQTLPSKAYGECSQK